MRPTTIGGFRSMISRLDMAITFTLLDACVRRHWCTILFLCHSYAYFPLRQPNTLPWSELPMMTSASSEPVKRPMLNLAGTQSSPSQLKNNQESEVPSLPGPHDQAVVALPSRATALLFPLSSAITAPAVICMALQPVPSQSSGGENNSPSPQLPSDGVSPNVSPYIPYTSVPSTVCFG